MPVGVFEPNNPGCQDCWGHWVQAQCKGAIKDFDRCDSYYEGCTKCQADFCLDGADNDLCEPC